VPGQAAYRGRQAASLRVLTSLRFLTVYPSGRVPSRSIRIGQRSHLDLDTQHLVFGCLDFEPWFFFAFAAL
jgi:hypothetical protein